MKIDFTVVNSPLRDMDEKTIETKSTSYCTADASPIVLKQTEQLRFTFNPVLVDNEKEPDKSVSGKIVYEKKKKKDVEYPSDKISKQSIKVGDLFEFQLNTSETYNLYQGLKALYELKNSIGNTPFGSSTYAKINTDFSSFKNIIESDPSTARLLSEPQNYELVKILLQLITTENSYEALKNGLQSLNPSNINNLSIAINTQRLRTVAATIDENLKNNKEEFWQNLFAENQWVLSQMFSTPYTIFEEKSYVGGKGLNNRGGNVCDFIYQNELTQNIAIIEIKTPTTQLIGQGYRNTYSLSTELSGAINQVLNYKDSLTKEFSTLLLNTSVEFKVFDPKCVVIVGCMSSLNSNEKATIERYRNTLNHITIITFDELLQKIKDTISLFEISENQLKENKDDITPDDLPF